VPHARLLSLLLLLDFLLLLERQVGSFVVPRSHFARLCATHKSNTRSV
jgi:hypothetical protein